MKYTVIYTTPKKRVLFKEVEATGYKDAVITALEQNISIDLERNVFVVNKEGRKIRIKNNVKTKIKKRLRRGTIIQGDNSTGSKT